MNGNGAVSAVAPQSTPSPDSEKGRERAGELVVNHAEAGSNRVKTMNWICSFRRAENGKVAPRAPM